MKSKFFKIIALVMVSIILVLFAGYKLYDNNISKDADASENKQSQTVAEADGDTDEDGDTYEGTTQMGTYSQLPDWEISWNYLQIEEVYVSAGDYVQAGTALYKISATSLANAINYYENMIERAENSYASAQLNYINGEAQAAYNKNMTEMEAELAGDSYEADLAELEAAVEDKKEIYEQALEDIETYTYNLENNTYYTDADIENKTANIAALETIMVGIQSEYDNAKNAYESAERAYSQALQQLLAICGNTELSDENIAQLQTLAAAVSSGYESVSSTRQTMEQASQQLNTGNMTLQSAKRELEQAQTEYDNNVAEAESKLEELSKKIDDYKSAYEAAVRNAEIKKLTIQNEYDTAVLNGDYAERNYESNIEQLVSSMDSALENLTTLKEELAIIEALGDGIIYAADAGTIASVTYDEDDIIQADTALVTYYNTQDITVSLEISQDKIAGIKIGDTATVSTGSSRMGSYEGVVTYISPSATTGNSATKVEYTVIVTVDNSRGMLSSGESVSITFGGLYEE